MPEIADPELKRRAAEAQAALAKRDHVAEALLTDWRKLSQPTNDYAARLEAGLLRNDTAACTGLERGVAAKSPGEILVTCDNEFDAGGSELDEKLSRLERLARA